MSSLTSLSTSASKQLLKQLITVSTLTAALCASSIALAEPMPPAGTTVDSIALTTVETSMQNGAMPTPAMSSSTMQNSDADAMPTMKHDMDSTSGETMGSMSSNMHDNMSDMMKSDTAMPDTAMPDSSGKADDGTVIDSAK